MNQIYSQFYYTFIVEDRYKIFLNGLGLTLLLTLVSFLCGILFGSMLCKLSRARNKAASKIASGFTYFLVQIPTLVLLMLFVYIIFGSTAVPVFWGVIIALTLKQGSYIATIFNTVLNEIDRGELEAAMTLGMNRMAVFWYIILPQVLQKGVGLYKNQFIAAMQETSVVGFLALVDLTRASSIVSSRTMNAMTSLLVITVLYFMIGIIAHKCIDFICKSRHLKGGAA